MIDFNVLWLYIKEAMCKVFGHTWYKPHPRSSAWQAPTHRQPPQKCRRCGVNQT